MDKLQLYRKRSKQLYYAFVLSLTITFLACLPLYFYFKLPVHPDLSRSMFFFLSVMGLAILPIGLLIKKRAFPVDSSKDPYWSYTATRRYFWLFLLSLVPFAFSFIVFIVFALIEVLLLGYVLSLCGLILVRPKEEDVIKLTHYLLEVESMTGEIINLDSGRHVSGECT